MEVKYAYRTLQLYQFDRNQLWFVDVWIGNSFVSGLRIADRKSV